MIERKKYMSLLEKWRDKKVIKVVTGVRRCGKSSLLRMFREKLSDNGVEERQILEFNFEDLSNEPFLDYHVLYSHIRKNLCGDRMNYIFFDEIQMVENFQKVVDSLFIRENIDLYITGSNAYMLSGELATLLSGRYISIEMLPLSFAEYVDWCGDKADLPKKYVDYLENSSFPYALELGGNPKMIDEYLRGIYSTVVLKDVLARLKTADPMILESVLRFVFDGVGSIVSTKKIADTLTSSGRKIDARTVERYLSACIDSYIVYRVKRYDVKGKQHLKTLDKYYASDMGLRSMLLGRKYTDVGHILENVVYLELVRRGYDVYIGKVDDMEIDFVASGVDGLEYYQVAATVREESTLERELRVLRKVTDNYPKYLLTLDGDPAADFDGIKKMNALEWLLGGRQ